MRKVTVLTENKKEFKNIQAEAWNSKNPSIEYINKRIGPVLRYSELEESLQELGYDVDYVGESEAYFYYNDTLYTLSFESVGDDKISLNSLEADVEEDLEESLENKKEAFNFNFEENEELYKLRNEAVKSIDKAMKILGQLSDKVDSKRVADIESVIKSLSDVRYNLKIASVE